MITTKLYGRLGNQMFQIANCIAHAVRHQQPYAIPRLTTHPNQWPSYFNHFPVSNIPIIDYAIYREESHAYHPVPRKEQICFDGYFQSYLYFWDQLQIVLDSFAAAFEFPQLDTINFTGHVSVHVRRGDYVELSAMHPPVTIDYIKKAVHHFANKGYTHFSIYSDDIEWCKQTLTPDLLNIGENYLQLIFHEPFKHDPIKNALFDMATMASHEHNIISNSTFSYWAAMMNRNPNKIVVTPALSNWFGPAYQNLSVKNLLPPGWLQMPADNSGIAQSNVELILESPPAATFAKSSTIEKFWCHMEQLCDERCKEACGDNGECGITD